MVALTKSDCQRNNMVGFLVDGQYDSMIVVLCLATLSKTRCGRGIYSRV